jgi:hypothetical protein
VNPPYDVMTCVTATSMPLRLQRIVANTWIKVRRRQSCCGNYGEPGC